ncbi:MAG TPA: trypsin-like peptidase domain-containing protein, partial [Anaerolineales bacterium]|nr:signal protein PDZ [Anaerolineae bacterium]HRK90270.1 trypsin-like peptidase domain-containing protein [Anaerolineales bacterium]
MSKNIFTELSEAMANAAEAAGKSTVMVDARRRIPASGIAFAKDLILTADHVVERDEDIRILLGDGHETTARLAGRDPGTDLAVLKLDSASATPADIAKSPARVGQFVLAIGRPSKRGIESSFGTVNSLGGPVRTGRGGMLDAYIKTDVVSYPGFSGGPLINGEGQVYGINTSGFGGGGAITIPVEVAWKVAETLAAHGKIKRGYLGIRSQTVNLPEEARSQLKREQETGLLIVGMEKDTPAEKSGLMVGDILVGVAGVAVEHHDELFVRLSGDVVGKSTPMDVLRGGTLQVVNVVV